MTTSESVTALKYTLTWADYHRFRKYMQWHDAKYSRLSIATVTAVCLLHAGIYAWAAFPILKIMHHVSAEFLILLLLNIFGVPIALLVGFIAVSYATLLNTRRTLGAIGARTLRATPDFLEVVTPFQTVRWRWERILRIESQRDLVMLFTSKTAAILIPFSAFASQNDAFGFAKLADMRRAESTAERHVQPDERKSGYWPPSPRQMIAPLSITEATVSEVEPPIHVTEVREPSIGYITANYSSSILVAALSILVTVIAYFDIQSEHGANALMKSIAIGLCAFVLIPLIILSNTRPAIRKATEDRAASAELRADEQTVTISSPSIAISGNVASLWSIHRVLRHTVIFTDPFTAFLIADSEFGGREAAKRFMKRIGAARAAGRNRAR